MRADLLEKLAKPVPRYTSYPTAPHFAPDIDADVYARWLSALPVGGNISLYLHIPYCHSLCWYCGCNTKATRRYEPVAAYLATLSAEIEQVAARLPAGQTVKHIHLGGGSPNILSAGDIERLTETVRRQFAVAADAEVAMEIDPRHFAADQATALQRAGFTRISVGVQDFEPSVQAAINRFQSFEVTQKTVDMCRAAGIGSVNVDLMYGLPGQRRASVAKTLAKVLELAPDRLAVFGYAHLPSRLRHQKLIDADTLPGIQERYDQAGDIADFLQQAGYARVGIDHFVRPDDPLVAGRAQRNFQGYTSDPCETLIGLGASAIGKLPQGYVQNAVPAADYARLVGKPGLAAVRGRALSPDDRVRAYAIERLMCDLSLDWDDLITRHRDVAQPVIDDAKMIIAADRDGLVDATPRGLRITERGRPFTRAICASFDAYLGAGAARHSSAI